jgi:hypothetical protein
MRRPDRPGAALDQDVLDVAGGYDAFTGRRIGRLDEKAQFPQLARCPAGIPS